jgi:hypothetical protein
MTFGLKKMGWCSATAVVAALIDGRVGVAVVVIY